MGRDWGSPYLSHCCLCCCLHCVAWALQEVTAPRGGRGRGQAGCGGRRGELWGRTQSRRPVSCEYQSFKVMGENSLGVFVLRTPFPQCSLSHCPAQPSPTELQAVTKSQARCHTQSHSLSHVVAQHRVSHTVSQRTSFSRSFTVRQATVTPREPRSLTQRSTLTHSDTQPHT